MKYSPRWIMVASAVAVLVAGAAWLAYPGATPAPAVSSNVPETRAPALTWLPSDTEILRIADTEAALRRADRALRDAHYAYSEPDLPPREPMWSPVTDGSEMPALELNTDIAHAEVVRLPAYEQLEKAPGDRLMIPLLEGRSLAVTVEQASRLPNGDYSWRGYVDGEEDDFPVIFTVGKQSAFATITSWEGSYTMESVGGVGWLYKNIVDRGEDFVPAPVEGESAHLN